MLQISSNPHSQSSLSAWLSALQLSHSKAWAWKLCSKHKWATQGEITAPNVIESSQGASDSSAQPTNVGKGATKRVGCCLLEQYSRSPSLCTVLIRACPHKGLYRAALIQNQPGQRMCVWLKFQSGPSQTKPNRNSPSSRTCMKVAFIQLFSFGFMHWKLLGCIISDISEPQMASAKCNLSVNIMEKTGAKQTVLHFNLVA